MMMAMMAAVWGRTCGGHHEGQKQRAQATPADRNRKHVLCVRAQWAPSSLGPMCLAHTAHIIGYLHHWFIQYAVSSAIIYTKFTRFRNRHQNVMMHQKQIPYISSEIKCNIPGGIKPTQHSTKLNTGGSRSDIGDCIHTAQYRSTSSQRNSISRGLTIDQLQWGISSRLRQEELFKHSRVSSVFKPPPSLQT